MAPDSVMQPVFVLGVGRCGSTYQQRLLSSAGDLWIWGEHDGFLRFLKKVDDLTEPGSPLARFALEAEAAKDLTAYGQGDATALAWMNAFTRADLREALTGLIVSLFASNLPEGRVRWGFKEIRYGPADGVPELLLDLFPRGRIVYAVRRPKDTVISSLVSWQGELLARQAQGDAGADAQLAERFLYYGKSWIEAGRYFRGLSEGHPDRVYVSRLESLPESTGALLDFCGVTPTRPVLGEETVNANPARRTLEESVRARLEALWEAHAPMFAEEAAALGY